jgi:spore coat polysaccharide biosynthesis protein SpsF
MRVGIFIQVRLASTRLPSKALLPLPWGTVIQHVMRSLAGVPADVRALVTEAMSVEMLSPLAMAEGFGVFIGPEQDVLARYCMAAREHRVDHVMRATGDNPLTSAALARGILSAHLRTGSDLSHYVGIPWGSGVEVVRSEALFIAEEEAVDPAEREHITTFLYRHPERFTIDGREPPPGLRLSEARVTVDTEEDYVRVKRIFEDLYRGEPLEVRDLAAWFAGAKR